MDMLERFEAKYIPEPNSGCWIWTGAVNYRGYGRFGLEGRNEIASRVSYEIYHGVDPGQLSVLHKCDTPCCVNPGHLFLGSTKDNSVDMAKKGRQPKAKLRNADIPVINYLLARGIGPTAIGRVFGVSSSAIQKISDGKAWSHVAQ